jgi:hypothetical protein
MMMLPQNSPRISEIKKDGMAKRAGLLKKMPNEFTAAQLATAADLTPDAARAQVQRMLLRKDIEPTSSYKTPRVYRKLKE